MDLLRKKDFVLFGIEGGSLAKDDLDINFNLLYNKLNEIIEYIMHINPRVAKITDNKIGFLYTYRGFCDTSKKVYMNFDGEQITGKYLAPCCYNKTTASQWQIIDTSKIKDDAINSLKLSFLYKKAGAEIFNDKFQLEDMNFVPASIGIRHLSNDFVVDGRNAFKNESLDRPTMWKENTVFDTAWFEGFFAFDAMGGQTIKFHLPLEVCERPEGASYVRGLFTVVYTFDVISGQNIAYQDFLQTPALFYDTIPPFLIYSTEPNKYTLENSLSTSIINYENHYEITSSYVFSEKLKKVDNETGYVLLMTFNNVSELGGDIYPSYPIQNYKIRAHGSITRDTKHNLLIFSDGIPVSTEHVMKNKFVAHKVYKVEGEIKKDGNVQNYKFRKTFGASSQEMYGSYERNDNIRQLIANTSFKGIGIGHGTSNEIHKEVVQQDGTRLLQKKKNVERENEEEEEEEKNENPQEVIDNNEEENKIVEAEEDNIITTSDNKEAYRENEKTYKKGKNQFSIVKRGYYDGVENVYKELEEKNVKTKNKEYISHKETVQTESKKKTKEYGNMTLIKEYNSRGFPYVTKEGKVQENRTLNLSIITENSNDDSFMSATLLKDKDGPKENYIHTSGNILEAGSQISINFLHNISSTSDKGEKNEYQMAEQIHIEGQSKSKEELLSQAKKLIKESTPLEIVKGIDNFIDSTQKVRKFVNLARGNEQLNFATKGIKQFAQDNLILQNADNFETLVAEKNAIQAIQKIDENSITISPIEKEPYKITKTEIISQLGNGKKARRILELSQQNLELKKKYDETINSSDLKIQELEQRNKKVTYILEQTKKEAANYKNEMKQKINKNRIKIKSLEEKTKELSVIIDEKEKNINQSKNIIKNLEQNIQELQQNAEENEHEINQSRETISNLNVSIQTLEKEVEENKNEIIDLKEQKNKVETKLELNVKDAQKTIISSNTKLLETKKLLDVYKKKIMNQIKRIIPAIEEAEHVLDLVRHPPVKPTNSQDLQFYNKKNDRLKSLTDEEKKIMQGLLATKTKVDELTQKFETVKKQIKEQPNSLAELQSNVQSTQEMVDIYTEMSFRHKNLHDLKNALDEQQQYQIINEQMEKFNSIVNSESSSLKEIAVLRRELLYTLIRLYRYHKAALEAQESSNDEEEKKNLELAREEEDVRIGIQKRILGIKERLKKENERLKNVELLDKLEKEKTDNKNLQFYLNNTLSKINSIIKVLKLQQEQITADEKYNDVLWNVSHEHSVYYRGDIKLKKTEIQKLKGKLTNEIQKKQEAIKELDKEIEKNNQLTNEINLAYKDNVEQMRYYENELYKAHERLITSINNIEKDHQRTLIALNSQRLNDARKIDILNQQTEYLRNQLTNKLNVIDELESKNLENLRNKEKEIDALKEKIKPVLQEQVVGFTPPLIREKIEVPTIVKNEPVPILRNIHPDPQPNLKQGIDIGTDAKPYETHFSADYRSIGPVCTETKMILRTDGILNGSKVYRLEGWEYLISCAFSTPNGKVEIRTFHHTEKMGIGRYPYIVKPYSSFLRSVVDGNSGYSLTSTELSGVKLIRTINAPITMHIRSIVFNGKTFYPGVASGSYLESSGGAGGH